MKLNWGKVVRSRTIWVNGLALIASIIQMKTGLVIDGQTQGVILTVVNAILRFFTNDSLFKEE